MNQPDSNSDTPTDIRGVLIQIEGGRLLLPNATVSEVLSYAEPEPVDEAPGWILGRIRWRGWQLPLVAWARLTGTAPDEAGGLGSKVAVLKALHGNPRLPYFALLTQGFPRLVTVSRSALIAESADGETLPEAALASVLLNEDRALVPPGRHRRPDRNRAGAGGVGADQDPPCCFRGRRSAPAALPSQPGLRSRCAARGGPGGCR